MTELRMADFGLRISNAGAPGQREAPGPPLPAVQDPAAFVPYGQHRVCGLRSAVRNPQSGLTLVEVIVAVTIAGLISLAAMFSLRIATRAWAKTQSATSDLRRVTNVEDMFEYQVANYVPREASLQLRDRRLTLPFFLASSQRLVFVSSYSARRSAQAGLVVADYYAESQPNGACSLWLNESPALNPLWLGQWVRDIQPVNNLGFASVRPFDKNNALLLWEGLSGCSFSYLLDSGPAPGWLPAWPVLGAAGRPGAVAFDYQSADSRWRGVAPVSMVAVLHPVGVSQ